MAGRFKLATWRSATGSRSRLAPRLPHHAIALSFFLLVLFFLDPCSDPKQHFESVQQIWVLVIQTACDWQVRPFHALAQYEHSQGRMSILDLLALEELFCLLD